MNNGGPTLPSNLTENPFRAVVWYLFTGNVITAYWYIPMAMLLFAVSPLVNVIIKSGKLLPCIIALTPISLVIHRPINNLNAVHSLIYFFPAYLIGVWSAIHHKQISTYLRDHKKKVFLGAMAIALGLIQIFVLKHPGNFHKEFWSITVLDVNFLQKSALCFLFLSLLDQYENTEVPSISKVAETSFAIYFIHPLLLNTAFSWVTSSGWQYEGNLVIWFLVGLATVIASMSVAYVFKTVLKKKSRYVIGW